jgi:hypothetical protein
MGAVAKALNICPSHIVKYFSKNQKKPYKKKIYFRLQKDRLAP